MKDVKLVKFLKKIVFLAQKDCFKPLIAIIWKNAKKNAELVNLLREIVNFVQITDTNPLLVNV